MQWCYKDSRRYSIQTGKFYSHNLETNLNITIWKEQYRQNNVDDLNNEINNRKLVEFQQVTRINKSSIIQNYKYFRTREEKSVEKQVLMQRSTKNNGINRSRSNLMMKFYFKTRGSIIFLYLAERELVPEVFDSVKHQSVSINTGLSNLVLALVKSMNQQRFYKSSDPLVNSLVDQMSFPKTKIVSIATIISCTKQNIQDSIATLKILSRK